MKLMLTFNCNISKLCVRFETRRCFNSLRFRVILKIYGIMARQGLANLFVLVLVSHNCFLRHSIIGGMVTKEKRQCSSRNGRSPVASSLATTSKSGQIAMLSNQKLRDPLCHLNAQDELWSLQTTRFKNASEQIQHCWQRSEDDSPKSTSTTTHSSTPSRVSSHPTDSPETSLEDWWCEDDWYWENGGEI